MKVRKKAIFNAEQWFPGKEVDGVSGDNPNRLCGCVIAGVKYFDKPHMHISSTSIEIVNEGDWIVTDDKGKKHVVSPDNFEKIYEKVEEKVEEVEDKVEDKAE